MRAVRIWGSTCLWLLAVLAAPSAKALDVERIEWGFDGRVVPMVFNLVTVEVANNSPAPFEGDVALHESGAVIRPVLPLVERQLYIEPFGRRRLQFFPFINENWAEFVLVWGRQPTERQPITSSSNPLRTGPPATVLLRDAGTSRQLRARLATFDEADFPMAAPGMDALRAVVLDHVPRWDALRMQALRDWIGAGGQVHILKGATGDYPRFAAPLEALNEPSDVVRLGNGLVFHHPLTSGEITDEFVAQSLGASREVDNPDNRGPVAFNYRYQPSSSIAPLLRDLTRPDHNWSLIYFLSFVYLLVVFPGCWLLGRRRADFRISYPALLGAVFLFSMAFKTVGQRGYGEETAWNAVGTARRIAPGRFLAETWSNAFVTSGGMYAFRHKGEGLLYSSGGLNDTRHGVCTNRPAAGIETEIPPFSSQTFLHASVVAAPDFDLELKGFEIRGQSVMLELELTGQPPTIHSMNAVHGNSRIPLARQGDRLISAGQSPLNSLAEQQRDYGFAYQSRPSDAPTVYASVEAPLMARSVRLISDMRSDELRAPDGLVRVFLYADMPSEFLDVEGGPERRQGRMLYVFDFPASEG